MRLVSFVWWSGTGVQDVRVVLGVRGVAGVGAELLVLGDLEKS